MKNILFICIALLSLASCAKEVGVGPDGDAVQFSIVPDVASSVSSGQLTRAKVDGVFASTDRVGLNITSSTPSANINAMYSNFYATYNGVTWGYYVLGGNSYLGTILSGFASWGNISVVGYYPYDPAMSNVGADFTAIPFSIGDVVSPGVGSTTAERAAVDYMVAGTKTKDMSTPGSDVGLAFDHMMTSLSLYWRRDYQGPQIKLTNVKFEISGGSRSFGIGGTYNAVNPNMTDPSSNLNVTDNVTTLNIAFDQVFTYSNGYRELPLLIMPQLRQTTGADGADDATVTVTLTFVDAFGSPYRFDNFTGDPSFSFKLSDITNQGQTDKGLLTGWNYRLAVNLGAYIRFKGAPYVVDPALDDNTPPEHIEI